MLGQICCLFNNEFYLILCDFSYTVISLYFFFILGHLYPSQIRLNMTFKPKLEDEKSVEHIDLRNQFIKEVYIYNYVCCNACRCYLVISSIETVAMLIFNV